MGVPKKVLPLGGVALELSRAYKERSRNLEVLLPAITVIAVSTRFF
jgi:hypothetical protein